MKKKRLLPLLLSAALAFNSIPVSAAEIVVEESTYITLPPSEDTPVQDADAQPEEEDFESENETVVNSEALISDQEVLMPENVTDIPVYDSYVSDNTSYGFPAECTGTFASKYDPRPLGKVSGIREQVNGSCWLYAAMSTVESNLIKNGFANSSIDLSELQPLYFMNHAYDDPLGNYSNDTATDGKKLSSAINLGSKGEVYSFFSKWNGPVYEEEAPLALEADGSIPNEYLDTVVLDKSLANKNYWHFESSKLCDYDTEHINNIKELISTYGGVSAGFYSAPAYYKATEEGGDASFYWGKKTTATHAVEIVGWDDNYSKDNFANKPSADGAWLVKNSAGFAYINGYTTSGYLWMSYYEPSLCDIAAVNFTSKYQYENMYAHDGENYGASGFLQPFPEESLSASSETMNRKVSNETLSDFDKVNVYGNSGMVFNIYKANAYEEGTVERIDAVMTFLQANASYDVTVYINPVIQDTKLVGYSGKTVTQYGKSTYAGYYTIPLSDPAYVTNGDTFAVCINSPAPELGMDAKTLVASVSGTKAAGQCYYATDLNNMIDTKWLSDYMGTTLSIPVARALTNKADYYTFSQSLTLDKTNLSLTKDSTGKITATVLPANATKPSAGFYTSDPGIATVDENGNIKAVNAGTCTITAKSYDGKQSASCQVTVTETKTDDKTASSGAAIPSSVKIGAVTYTYANEEMTVSKIDSARTVSIPATITVNGKLIKVTKIAKNACKGNKKVTKVTIGNNIKEIGSTAFSGCPKLKKVSVGTNVVSIGKKAFYNNASLSSVTIKSVQLKTVGASAFKKLAEKSTIKVPKSKSKAYKKLFKKKCAATTAIK